MYTYTVFYTLNDMHGLKTEIDGKDVIDALTRFKKYIEANFHVATFSVQAIRRNHSYSEE